MKKGLAAAAAAFLCANFNGAAFAAPLERAAPKDRGILVADSKRAIPVLVDARDYPVVKLSANLFAGDVQKITGTRPSVGENAPATPAQTVIIAGTVGHSKLVDDLARSAV